MNDRSRSFAPALSAFAMLALLTAAAPAALAQGAPPPPGDSVTVIARQRYNEGVKAYDAGRYEDARAFFLQAYALKHHPAVLLNLGQSELRSGHFDDAGNHLSQFVREWTQATPDERAAAEKGLAEAKKKSGLIVVGVDAQGADISVDGTTLGKSPLLDPVFVKPGKHTIFATLQGKSAAVSVDAKAGTAAPANLVLGITAAPQPPPPQPPPPIEPQQPPPPQPPPPQPPVAPPPQQPLPPVMEPMQPPPGGMEQPPPLQQKVSFIDWYKRKPIAWVGTGAAGLGLIGGIIFGASATSASNASKTHTALILKENMMFPKFNPDGRPNLCGDANGNGPLPHYAQACGVLQTDISNYHTDVALAATSWVLFGVGVVGTAIYTMVDWYPHRTSTTMGSLPSFTVAPIWGEGQRGITVLGSF